MQSGEIKPSARGGWALVEVLVCAVIISTTAASVVEFAGVTSRMSHRAHERGAMSMDLWSLVNAVDLCASVDASRGGWSAGVTNAPAGGGLWRADIRAGLSDDMTPYSLEWSAWNIRSRGR